MRERERERGREVLEEVLEEGRTQGRVRLGELERTGTLLQSSFCKHLYRHTKIIEKQFFLHMVVRVFMYLMNECCGCMISFICSRR
jgi:hypothetical protein